MLRPAPHGRVHLVGGAAGPLGGDDLALTVRVGPGASLVVRGVAAMLAQPGPNGGVGRLALTAEVAAGGALDWDVQPLIAITGADLETSVELNVATGASVRWREELVLGRGAEVPGRVRARTRLVQEGAVTLDHVQPVGGPDGPWSGAGGLSGHRWLATEVRIGLDGAGLLPPHASPSGRSADLVLASGAVLRSATATDRATGLVLLDGPETVPASA